MRNLKKILALVLALVMSLSLVTIASAKSASDFSDGADITYTEAVDVMTAIGVIDGVGNNTFDPNGTLTREQAAKIVATMLLGTAEADRLGTNTQIFKDVAAGYIAYCANEGILAGTGNGKFDPTGILTGAQFGKMLLVALGYDPKVEGYTGASWAINVATDMFNAGIDMDDVILSQPLTRDQATEMAFLTIKAPLVEYGSRTEVNVNGATVVVGGNQAHYVTSTVVAEAGNISKDKLANSTNEYLVEFGEKYFKDLKLVDGKDDFGRPAGTWSLKNKEIGEYGKDPVVTYTKAVTLGDLYKDLGLGKATTAAPASGTTEEGGSVVATILRNGTNLAALGGGTAGDVVVGAKNAGGNMTASDVTGATNAVSKGSKDKIGGNGVLVEVYSKDVDATSTVKAHTEYTIIMVDTYVAKVNSVTAASSTKDRYITLAMNSSTVTSAPQGNFSTVNADFETESFAAKDLVTYTAAAGSNNKYDIKSVKLLEKSGEGELTAVTGANSSSTNNDATANFAIDGTTYNYSKNPGFALTNDDLKSKYDLYADEYGYIIYAKETEAANNYAVVIGVGSNNPYGDESGGATLLLADGTKVAVNYKMAGSSSLTGANKVDEIIGDLVTYTVGSDGVYTLTLKQAFQKDSGGSTFDDDNTVITNGRSELKLGASVTKGYATSDTVFFVCTGTATTVGTSIAQNEKLTYNVYQGYANMPSMKGAANKIMGYAIDQDSTSKQVKAVYIASNNVSGTTRSNTYILNTTDALDNVVSESDKTPYVVLPAVVDGQVTTLKVAASLIADSSSWGNSSDGALYSATLPKGFLLKDYTTNSDGIITAATADGDLKSGHTSGGIEGADKGVIGIDLDGSTMTYFAYADDIEIVYIEEDETLRIVSDVSSIVTDSDDTVQYVVKEETSPTGNQLIVTAIYITKK